MKLNESTASAIITPGKMNRCGAVNQNSRESSIIFPHEGIGSGTTQSEKAHARLGEYRARHSERRLNYQRLNRVGQNVFHHDSSVAGSERASCGNEIVFAD